MQKYKRKKKDRRQKGRHIEIPIDKERYRKEKRKK